MMVCLEWWLFEIANMLSGTLPNPERALAVTGVCSQVIALAFMVPLGICSGLRIRVANLLGKLHQSFHLYYLCNTIRLPKVVGKGPWLVGRCLPCTTPTQYPPERLQFVAGEAYRLMGHAI